jgi:hypothetical protein
MIRRESRLVHPPVVLIDTAELAVLLDRTDRASRERLALLLAGKPVPPQAAEDRREGAPANARAAH